MWPGLDLSHRILGLFKASTAFARYRKDLFNSFPWQILTTPHRSDQLIFFGGIVGAIIGTDHDMVLSYVLQQVRASLRPPRKRYRTGNRGTHRHPNHVSSARVIAGSWSGA